MVYNNFNYNLPPPQLPSFNWPFLALITTEATPLPRFIVPIPHPSQGSHPVLSNCSQSVSNRLTLFLAHVISSDLKMKKAKSSETSLNNKSTRRHSLEDGILHSHRRENLKSYLIIFCLIFAGSSYCFRKWGSYDK
jgi:hypothetical protein